MAQFKVNTLCAYRQHLSVSVCSYQFDVPQQLKAHGSVVLLIGVTGKGKGKVQIRIGH